MQIPVRELTFRELPNSQSPIRQLLLASATLLTFIPYHFITSWLSISVESTLNFALLSLQVISTLFLFLCFKKQTSRSFKLFWQYLFLAILTVFAIVILVDISFQFSF